VSYDGVMRWWVVALGLIGCVRSASVECDDGRLCPAGFMCVADGCRRVTACGDGELGVGEECDDGNSLSHDGCSSRCLTEQPVWHEVTVANGPEKRRGHMAAWLPDAGHGVMYGGIDNAVLTDTWIWTGSWTRGPDGPERVFHAIAFDGRDRLIMFGGSLQDTTRAGDTWAWDGAAWTQVATTGPSPRVFHVMAPTGRAGEVLLWGGNGLGTGTLDDTWLWNGAWTAGPPDTVMTLGVRLSYYPGIGTLSAGDYQGIFVWNGSSWSTRESILIVQDHVQEYIPERHSVVLFGGDASPGVVDKTDEWDGHDWHLYTLTPRPPKRAFSAGFYDPIRHGLVMFGGEALATFLNDTWMLRWESATPDEVCDGTSDADGDGLVGCDDPDCWGLCTPHCMPGTICDPSFPHCGDGVCNPALETPTLCPSDCP
jgi:cysteine-rich repeat protein